MEARNVGLLVAAVVVLGFAEGSAQARGDGAFQPLLADPKEPQFFATYLWDRSPRLGSRLASVGFGQTIGLVRRSEEHTSELQSPCNLVCRLLLEKKKLRQRRHQRHDLLVVSRLRHEVAALSLLYFQL